MTNKIAILSDLVFFFLAITMSINVVSAQTLTGVNPTNHIESPPLTQIHGGQVDLVHGPTILHRNPTPLPNHEAQPMDTAVQTTTNTFISGTTGANFDGINVYSGGYIPSDSNIAVGPNHIVETVN